MAVNVTLKSKSFYRLIILSSFLVAKILFAHTCFLTMVKGGCWKSYDLTVTISNADNGKQITTTIIPENQLWIRKEFQCKPSDMLALEAKFSPIFWEGDEDKTYKGQRYWKLPDAIKKGETGWNITVCYPAQFADVPFPPGHMTDCSCHLNKIPKIEPQKIP